MVRRRPDVGQSLEGVGAPLMRGRLLEGFGSRVLRGVINGCDAGQFPAMHLDGRARACVCFLCGRAGVRGCLCVWTCVCMRAQEKKHKEQRYQVSLADDWKLPEPRTNFQGSC